MNKSVGNPALLFSCSLEGLPLLRTWSAAHVGQQCTEISLLTPPVSFACDQRDVFMSSEKAYVGVVLECSTSNHNTKILAVFSV